MRFVRPAVLLAGTLTIGALTPVHADPDATWIERTWAVSTNPVSLVAPATRQRRTSVASDVVASGDTGDEKLAAELDGGCIPTPLRRALADIEASIASIKVTSTCRSRRQNTAVGGASHSYHLSGEAVDFRVSANPRLVLDLLARHPDVGGYKHYGGGLFHIDTGPHRTF